MPEPVKCPDCGEGQLVERGYETQHYGLYYGKDGELDVAPQPADDYNYEPDCYLCLMCGAAQSEETIRQLLKEGPNV